MFMHASIHSHDQQPRDSLHSIKFPDREMMTSAKPAGPLSPINTLFWPHLSPLKRNQILINTYGNDPDRRILWIIIEISVAGAAAAAGKGRR
ncbi:hypothetical protein SUGI_0067520 [Cryptomeria japonica]|nr:hypothetical protein SUGI_0067520 [Cryptomeria japonica]